MKQIQAQAEAHNVQISPDSNPGTQTRNIFVEGSEDSFVRVKNLIDEIIETQMRIKQAVQGDSELGGLAIHVTLSIPVTALPTVVGKNGENFM